MEGEIERLLLQVARAVVEEGQDRHRAIGLIVEASASYIVRRETLRRYLEAGEVEDLAAYGYVRPVLVDLGTDAMLVRTPEVVAGMVARVLADELTVRTDRDATAAGRWLADAANSLPLGEIVAAQAVLDAVAATGGVSPELIRALFALEPRETAVQPGMRGTLRYPDGRRAELTYRKGGVVEIECEGRVEQLGSDALDGDLGTVTDLGGWLVLSHVAGVPLELREADGRAVRVDEALLRGVGKCPLVLQRPNPQELARGIPVHDVPGHGSIVCAEAGMVEPITMSMFKFLSGGTGEAEAWVRESAGEDSLPLLARVAMALERVAQLAGAKDAAFGRRMLDDVVKPALGRFPALH